MTFAIRTITLGGSGLLWFGAVILMCHRMGRTGCEQVRFAFARLFIVTQ